MYALDIEILDALRENAQTISQIHSRLKNRTRGEILRALARLTRLRIVSQESITTCGNQQEVPYYMMPGAELTQVPQPPAPSSQAQALPIEEDFTALSVDPFNLNEEYSRWNQTE